MQVRTDKRDVDGVAVETLEVELANTTVLCISTPVGYLMCGILDTDVLDRLHPERRVVAARIEGVRTIDDLLQQPVTKCTTAAANRGVSPGMSGREALRCLAP